MKTHIQGTETIILREEPDNFIVYAHALYRPIENDPLTSGLIDLHASEHETLEDAMDTARKVAQKYNVREHDIFCQNDEGDWDSSLEARAFRV